MAAVEQREESKQVKQEGDRRAGIVSGSAPTDQSLARRTGTRALAEQLGLPVDRGRSRSGVLPRLDVLVDCLFGEVGHAPGPEGLHDPGRGGRCLVGRLRLRWKSQGEPAPPPGSDLAQVEVEFATGVRPAISLRTALLGMSTTRSPAGRTVGSRPSASIPRTVRSLTPVIWTTDLNARREGGRRGSGTMRRPGLDGPSTRWADSGGSDGRRRGAVVSRRGDHQATGGSVIYSFVSANGPSVIRTCPVRRRTVMASATLLRR